MKEEYGGILMSTAIQKRGLVRFRNEMFKTYVRMRPSIYVGVDEAVMRAYRRRSEEPQVAPVRDRAVVQFRRRPVWDSNRLMARV